MAAEIKFLGLSIEHPHGRERSGGAVTSVRLNVTVGKSPAVRSIHIADEDDQMKLIKLLEQGATALRVLNSA